MKQNGNKPKKRDRRRLAVQIIAIALTALLVLGAIFYTIYFIVDRIRAKKNTDETTTAYAVTETAEPIAYLF